MPTKPRLLQIASLLLLGLGGGFAVGLLLAPFDFHIYSVNNQTMGGRQFADTVGLPIGLMSVTFCIAGWGLLRNRTWARRASLVAVACLGFTSSWVTAIAPGGHILAPHLVATRLFVGIAAWYLYFARGPKAYFAALADAERSGA